MAEPFDIVGENYVLAVLDSFGGLRPMAKHLDVGVSTVQGWKQRSKIPANRLEDIRQAAKANGIILPDSFMKSLAGDPEMNPEVLEKADLSPSAPPPNTSQQQILQDDRSDEASDAFHERKPRESEPEMTMEEAMAMEMKDIDGHGGDEVVLPKSTVGHWALLLSFVAILAVVTRPLWSEGIDRKLIAAISDAAHHGEEGDHGDGHGDPHGEEGGSLEVGAVLERINNLEERLGVVEQSSANLALLSFNFQQAQEDGGGNVFGGGLAPGGMSAEELKRLETLTLDVEILKKGSVTNQVQIDSLSGLLKQLEENSRLLSRRVEGVEQESGRLFEREFDRSIGVLYALERLDTRIRDGLNYTDALNDFEQLLTNSARTDIAEHLDILERHIVGVAPLSVLAQQYSDSLYPVLVAKTDHESQDWQTQVVMRLRSLIHFKKQTGIDELNGLLKAEYLLEQGELSEAIGFARDDILTYGQDTRMLDWLERANAREAVLAAVDAIRQIISNTLIDSINDVNADSTAKADI